jgi:tetratricopeptide (TPR) repeat protein
MKRIILVGWVVVAVTVGGVGVSFGENCGVNVVEVVRKAIRLADLGRWEEGLGVVEESVAKCPGEHELYFWKGMYLFRGGRFEEALSVFEVARRLGRKMGERTDGNVAVTKGILNCYVLLGRCEQAVEEGKYLSRLGCRGCQNLGEKLKSDGCEGTKREIEEANRDFWK